MRSLHPITAKKFSFRRCLMLALLVAVKSAVRAGDGSFTSYEIHEQNSLTQTGPSTFVPGIPNGGDQFSIVASVDTAGASLSAAPVLGLPAPTQDIPSGTVTFSTGADFSPDWTTGKGYDEYHWGDGYTTGAELNSVYGSGTFTFTLGDATAMPTLSLDMANPAFPVSPTVTSGGAWKEGHLLVNPAVVTILAFNSSSFSGYSTGLGGQIKFEFVDSGLMPIFKPAVSQNLPGYKADPALTSYMIAPGLLLAGQTYLLQANYKTNAQINTTSFSGTGIKGDPAGLSGYLTSTFAVVDAIPFTLLVANLPNSTAHLQGVGVLSAVNRIEFANDLTAGGGFTTLTPVNGNEAGALQYDDINAGTKKFYRLAYP
jgi:hypothetical protein